MSSTITCPNCKSAFEISEVMSAQLTTEIRSKLEAELAPERQRLAQQTQKLNADRDALERQRSAIEDQVRERLDTEREKLAQQARAKAAEELAVELKDRDTQLSEVRAKLKDSQDRELASRKKERELAEREESLRTQKEQMAEQVKHQVSAERQKLLEEGRKKAADELAAQVKERDEEVIDLKEKLRIAVEQESALRKRKREVEERAEQMQLEVDRQLEAGRQQIREAAKQQVREELDLKIRDEQEKNEALRKQIDELKRRSEKGSQQAQGETLELVVEEMLADAFRTDGIEEVRKGVHGADVMQKVRTQAGTECGIILWETKRAKNWQAEWLRKAREDQRNAGAAVAIIVSEVMPAGVSDFALVDEVWVCRRSCAVQLATAIRSGMLELASARRAMEGQQGKMEQVYNYLASPAFRNRVNGMLEPLVRMKAELAAEKRAIQTHWSRREKQIDQAILGAGGMYGDFQGIIGGTLPQIEGLELAITEEAPRAKALPPADAATHAQRIDEPPTDVEEE